MVDDDAWYRSMVTGAEQTLRAGRDAMESAESGLRVAHIDRTA